jgi:hypothetical protein
MDAALELGSANAEAASNVDRRTGWGWIGFFGFVVLIIVAIIVLSRDASAMAPVLQDAAAQLAAQEAAQQAAAQLAAQEAAQQAAAELAAQLAAQQAAAQLAAQEAAAQLAIDQAAAAQIAAEEAAAAELAAQQALDDARSAADQADEEDMEAAQLAAEMAEQAAQQAAAEAAEAQRAAQEAAEEAARLAAEQDEAARLAAEQEAARLAAEQEAARLAAEQDEAARLAAEQDEAARLAAEQEAARLAAEQEAARLAAEQEAARLAAAQEAARLAAEQEAARLAAEQEEAARLAAEQEEAARRASIRDCEVGLWRDVGSCQPACRESIHTAATIRQVRDVTQQPTEGGLPCPALEQTRACTLAEVPYCDRDCVENYSPWSECLPKCRGSDDEQSTQFRTRMGPPLVMPIGNGRACDNAPIQERVCPDVERCPVDCKLSPWSEWSPCSKPCREAADDVVTRRRTRTIQTPPAFGGEACPTPLEEVEVCDLPVCPPEDCEVSEWSEWSACPAYTGQSRTPGSTQRRSRTITRLAGFGGAACPTLLETRGCPVDCDGFWSDWSECSKPCGDGLQTRTFTITQQPQNEGFACPATTQTRSCNLGACPTCTTGPWGPWLNRRRTPCCFYLDGEFVGLSSIKPHAWRTRERAVIDERLAQGRCVSPPITELRQTQACPSAFSPELWEVYGGEHCVDGDVEA